VANHGRRTGDRGKRRTIAPANADVPSAKLSTDQGGCIVSVTLYPHIEALIQEKVKSGRFRNATEVVEEAILQMDDRDRLVTLRALLAEAETEVASGEAVEWTPDLKARLIRESEENSRKGFPIPDRVKP
jgi:putative addiction module CopG family antidote